MEGSGSDAIFDSLGLNPQIFINEVFNSAEDLVDGAFDYFHQRASTMLEIEGTDRSDELNKGVAYLRNKVQTVLNKRLSLWEKYCLTHCFAVPEGVSIPKGTGSAGESSNDEDILKDRELDVQLDSLRNELATVREETAELNKELRALEIQSVLNSRFALSVNEASQLYEQHSVPDTLEELTKTATELRKKMEQLKGKRLEQAVRSRTERMNVPTGDLLRRSCGNGLSNLTAEELKEFVADIDNI